MSDAIKFYDQDDREVSLDTLCDKEPAWAANRMREGIKRIAELERENSRHVSEAAIAKAEKSRQREQLLNSRADRDRLCEENGRLKTERESIIDDTLAVRRDKERLWQAKLLVEIENTTLTAERDRLKELGHEAIHQLNKSGVMFGIEATRAMRNLWNEMALTTPPAEPEEEQG